MNYTASLAHTYAAGLGPAVKGIELILLPFQSILPLARNQLVAEALIKKADRLLFIDDDISWRPQDIEAMIATDRDIVHAPYFLRTAGTPVLSYNREPGQSLLGSGDDDLMQVRQVATGLTLIKASVFSSLARDPRVEAFKDSYIAKKFPGKGMIHDFFPMGVREIDGEPMYAGEDVCFSLLAGAAGWKMFVYRNGVVGHHHGSVNLVCDFKQLRRDVANGVIETD